MIAKAPRLVWAVSLALVLVLVVAVVWWLTGAGGPGRNPQAAPRTVFSDLTPAAGPPSLPSLATLHPRPGTVVQASGPFDDRFRLRNLAFDGASVTGTAEITSDVSELLEFEAVAGFYDADGNLLGTGRDVHHVDESTVDPDQDQGPPDESRPFRIGVPGPLRGTAVAAAVGVPVLVNE